MGTIYAMPSPASPPTSACPSVIVATTKSSPPPPLASSSSTTTLAPAPPLSTASTTAFVPLSHAINTATRPLHTALNDLITARLPLCLPPQAPTAALYLAGLEALLCIFGPIETAFDRLAADADASFLETAARSDTTILVSAPATLLPKGLARTPRLRCDIAALQEHLRETSTPISHPAPWSAQNTSYGKGQDDLDALLHAYAAHISTAAAARPHVLLAYAWVMYMGVLSGGRWIRAQIDASATSNASADGAAAGAATTFWPVPTASSSCKCNTEDNNEDAAAPDDGDVSSFPLSSDPGRLFLRFARGTHDGEDVKRAFRDRFAAADAALPPALRDDVAREAEVAFTWIVRLVAALDGVAADAAAGAAATHLDFGRGDDAAAARRRSAADMAS